MSKKIISMLLIVAMFVILLSMSAFSAFAGDVTDVTQSTDGLWQYSFVDGGVELTAYKGTDTDVYVPSYISVDGEKLSVIKLADGIFMNNNGLNSVSIGNGVLEIGAEAFAYCKNLKMVSIPESVTNLGDSVFMCCQNLESVTLPDNITSLGTYAFYDCRGLKSISIPDNVTYIGLGAFMSCVSLKELKLPACLASFGDYPFDGCTGLESIHIPASFGRIGLFPFGGCTNLVSITVDENNPYYDSRDNCNAMIETYTNTLVVGCKSTVIPDDVTGIGEGAFRGCDGLRKIIIPNSVKRINDIAFQGCSDLEDVYYYGTEEQWNAIDIGNLNNELLNATIHYVTEEPAQDPAFSGASLTLHDNISINFKANESLFTEVGYENPYVVYELNGEEFIVSDYEIVGGKYVFDFADIAPNNMNDTVKATLYATFDGVEYVSETREYSVATYCYNMLNKYTTAEYAELQTLLVDLLNYGAMSQIYTNYNTENLVNANLTDAQRAWGTSETPAYETVQNVAYKTIENPTVTWKGGGLNLVDAVTMRFKITADSGSYENLVVKAETDDRIWTIPYEEFSETTGGYYVYFSGLNAGEMSEPVYLTVYENDEAVSNTLSYSIKSYAYSKQTSTDTNLTNLLEAMMKYGNSAYVYAN